MAVPFYEATENRYIIPITPADLAGVTTDDLAEGVVNKYFNDSRAIDAIQGTHPTFSDLTITSQFGIPRFIIGGLLETGSTTTDDLPEGSTNRYFTDARSRNAFQPGSGYSTGWTAGDMMYMSGTSTLARVPLGIDAQILTLTGGVPTWANLSASSLTGIVAIANGGTNSSSTANTNGVCYYDGTSITRTAQGGTNTILIANGGAPSFSSSPTATQYLCAGTTAASTPIFSAVDSNNSKISVVAASTYGMAFYPGFTATSGSYTQMCVARLFPALYLTGSASMATVIGLFLDAIGVNGSNTPTNAWTLRAVDPGFGTNRRAAWLDNLFVGTGTPSSTGTAGLIECTSAKLSGTTYGALVTSSNGTVQAAANTAGFLKYLGASVVPAFTAVAQADVSGLTTSDSPTFAGIIVSSAKISGLTHAALVTSSNGTVQAAANSSGFLKYLGASVVPAFTGVAQADVSGLTTSDSPTFANVTVLSTFTGARLGFGTGTTDASIMNSKRASSSTITINTSSTNVYAMDWNTGFQSTSAAVTSIAGIYLQPVLVLTSSATLGKAYGLQVPAFTQSGTVVPSESYGVQVNNPGVGTVRRAMRVDDLYVGTGTPSGTGTAGKIECTSLTVSGQTANYVAIYDSNTPPGLSGEATLAISRGGTNSSSTANTNGVSYYDGSSITRTAQGGANTVLTANSGAPSFSSTPTITSVTFSGSVSPATQQALSVYTTYTYAGNTTAGATESYFDSDGTSNKVAETIYIVQVGKIVTINFPTFTITLPGGKGLRYHTLPAQWRPARVQGGSNFVDNGAGAQVIGRVMVNTNGTVQINVGYGGNFAAGSYGPIPPQGITVTYSLL